MSIEPEKEIGFGRTGDRYAVMLPCEPDVFADFIGKLLGRPQTSDGSLVGDFEIDRAAIENIYNLVDQRVAQQNSGNLISFSVSITYLDKSGVTLNSYDDFLSYAETRPIVASSLTMSWIYLLKFKSSLSPEKQQIDIWLNTFSEYDAPRNVHESIDSVQAARYRRNVRDAKGIHFRISHTNRTWGNDIQNLLYGHLQAYKRRLDPFRSFMSSNCFWIGLISFLVVEIGSLAFLANLLDAYLEKLKDKARTLSVGQGVGFSQVNEKIDYIIELFLTQAFTKQTLGCIRFVLLSIIVSIVIGAAVGASAAFTDSSFILINKESQNYKAAFLRSREYSISTFFITLTGGIIVGVMGNIVYYFVAKYFGIQ